MEKAEKSFCVLVGVALLAASLTTVASASDTKDECLRHGVFGRDQIDSIPSRIARLEAEIAKGDNAYTGQELLVLVDKLARAKKELHSLMKPGK